MLMRSSSTDQIQAIGIARRSFSAPVTTRAASPRQLVSHSSTGVPAGVTQAHMRSGSRTAAAALRIRLESDDVDVAHGSVADGLVDLVRGRVGEVREERHEVPPAIELVGG